MRSFQTLWIIVTGILVLCGQSHCQGIVDMFSNIDSCDVTVDNVTDKEVLDLVLIKDGQTLQTRSLILDGPGTYVISWAKLDSKEDPYQVCAKIVRDGVVQDSECYDFLNAGRVPVRFDIRDFLADSKGILLNLYATDPTIVDIDYMLISNNKSIYVSQEKGVSISGSSMGPLQTMLEWKQLLTDGREYAGRVKIKEINHGQTRAVMNYFIAREDAKITETYEDEMGASATVLGNSRVPFEGSLRFTLKQNDSLIEIKEEKTPVLVLGDDETVEVSWSNTLNPGIYRLEITLLNRNGEPLDVKESVIEAEPMANGTNTSSTSTDTKKSYGVNFALALMIMLLSSRFRRVL